MSSSTSTITQAIAVKWHFSGPYRVTEVVTFNYVSNLHDGYSF